MRLAALFSGGKDSVYSVYAAGRMGHEVCSLVSVEPASPDSMLLHHPGIRATRLQAEVMGVPHRYAESPRDTAVELATLHSLLAEEVRCRSVRGVVHGGILSRYQLSAFGDVCGRLGLELVSPIWHRDQSEYMRELLRLGFRFIVTSVASAGLDGSWLGREVTAESLAVLERLSDRFGFNLSFEGGEAETLVIDCPLFSSGLCVRGSARWDGYRGSFEIEEMGIGSNA